MSADNWLIERVWAEDFDGDGFYVGRADATTNSADNNILRDCRATRNLRSGITITHGTGNIIQGCLLEGNQQGVVPGAKFSDIYRTGELNLEPNTAGEVPQVVEYNIIIGNTIRNGAAHGLTLQRLGASVRHNIVRNNHFIDNAGVQLAAFTEGASESLIEGNTFEATSPGSIKSHLAIYRADNICIRANTFTGGTDSSSRPIILDLDTVNIAFIGNHFDFAGGVGDGRSIWFATTTQDTYFYANDLPNAVLENHTPIIEREAPHCALGGG
jgi:parallel beta-helix repeat protein